MNICPFLDRACIGVQCIFWHGYGVDEEHLKSVDCAILNISLAWRKATKEIEETTRKLVTLERLLREQLGKIQKKGERL